MPRPRKPGAPEPKRRSRKGCWPCKARKVKCGEEKPACMNCMRLGEACDYSIRLNWEGRVKKKPATESTNPPSSAGRTSMMSMTGTILFSHQTPSQLSPAPRAPPPRATTAATTTTLQFSVSTPRMWAPELSRPLSQGVGDAQTQHSPVTPISLLDSPSINGDYGSEKSPAPSIEHQASPATSPSERAQPPSKPVQKVLSQYEIPPVPLSQVASSPSSPSDTLLSPGIGPLTALSFESHSVSQPTSFLRQSGSGPTTTAPASPPRETQEHSAPLGKRARSSTYAAHSSVFHAQDLGAPRKGSASTISDIPYTPSGPTISRMSVNSLLSPDFHHEHGQNGDTVLGFNAERPPMGGSIEYGLDHGTPDQDVNDHQDAGPRVRIFDRIGLDRQMGAEARGSEVAPEDPERKTLLTAGGYYATHVPIRIPRKLSPLPRALLENPINLMYFHHFLNHTARLLVPHDCVENPFRSVMPSMAIEDPNLLNLMLAYSASHRARFLRHPEPSNRIALWVHDVFPALRHALDDPHKHITDSHLATAIMLLSLEIVSPGAFGVEASWQTYLSLARDLFRARQDQCLIRPEDERARFLTRWLAYLDVFGSLSCRFTDPPLFDDPYWPPNEDDEFRVDCFTGFTPRTGLYLARLSRLTNSCDNERFDKSGQFRRQWTPSPPIISEAHELLEDMHYSQQRGHTRGNHHTEQENLEMSATDRAFHWAAVLHAYRRVLCKAPDSDVATAVGQLIDALGEIPPGSSTEVSILFPLFTAGCEARDSCQRSVIVDRVKNFEAEGLRQIRDARWLMERCWKTDLPWIVSARKEFLG